MVDDLSAEAANPPLIRDDIDAIVFGLAEKVKIGCEVFDRLSPPNFKHMYKWYPHAYAPDQCNYYQVEIKNGEIWVGTTTKHNRGFDLCDPDIVEKLQEWLVILSGYHHFYRGHIK